MDIELRVELQTAQLAGAVEVGVTAHQVPTAVHRAEVALFPIRLLPYEAQIHAKLVPESLFSTAQLNGNKSNHSLKRHTLKPTITLNAVTSSCAMLGMTDLKVLASFTPI